LVTFTLSANAAPDMFYADSMLERLKASEPPLLNRLFCPAGGRRAEPCL